MRFVRFLCKAILLWARLGSPGVLQLLLSVSRKNHLSVKTEIGVESGLHFWLFKEAFARRSSGTVVELELPPVLVPPLCVTAW